MTARRLGAGLLGTAGLLLAIVGSGIASASAGDASTQLFQHAVVVGAALAALIATVGSVPAFLGAQLIGTLAAAAVIRWLFHPSAQVAAEVAVPHAREEPT